MDQTHTYKESMCWLVNSSIGLHNSRMLSKCRMFSKTHGVVFAVSDCFIEIGRKTGLLRNPQNNPVPQSFYAAVVKAVVVQKLQNVPFLVKYYMFQPCELTSAGVLMY